MDELEVYFCDLCNTSVPVQDLGEGAAKRVRDKVVGACCLAELGLSAKPASANPSAASGGGVTLAGFFVVLAAIAAATIFLDWRIHEDSSEVSEGIATVAASVRPLEDQLADLESRVDRTLVSGALDPLESQIGEMAGGLATAEERVAQVLRDNAGQLRDIGTQITALDSGQRDHLARISEIHGEMRTLRTRLDEVADLAARAESAASVVTASAGWVPPPPTGLDPRSSGAGIPTSQPSAGATLPDALQHFVSQLSDADDGARFEAVDELLQSGDPRVYPYLLPLVTDPDPFVRRFVCEGLREYPNRAAVDALLSAMSDPESLVRYTAHASLKTLTQQDFPFDPDASAGKRASMKRRWEEWWKKNADGLF